MAVFFRENQYYDNETDFCRVFDPGEKEILERRLLDNRISYFTKMESKGVLHKLLGVPNARSACYVIRINRKDLAAAGTLLEGLRSAQLLEAADPDDWAPMARKKKAEKAIEAKPSTAEEPLELPPLSEEEKETVPENEPSIFDEEDIVVVDDEGLPGETVAIDRQRINAGADAEEL